MPNNNYYNLYNHISNQGVVLFKAINSVAFLKNVAILRHRDVERVNVNPLCVA